MLSQWPVDSCSYVRQNETRELAIHFAPSAKRHGIRVDRALHVIQNCPDPIYPPRSTSGETDRVLFLGPDHDGVPLEVLAVELARGDLLVIHVMKLRPNYRDAYQRVMLWHERS